MTIDNYVRAASNRLIFLLLPPGFWDSRLRRKPGNTWRI